MSSPVVPTARTGSSHSSRVIKGIVAVVLCTSLAWCVRSKEDQPDKVKHGQSLAPVSAVAIQKGIIKIEKEAVGTVTSLSTVTVKNQIAGQLTKVGFAEGQVVKAGDFLVEIDPRPYENALQQAQGTLLKDQATLKESQATLERDRASFEIGALAKQDIETQEALVEQNQGTVQNDTAQVSNAKLNLVYCHITAPADGKVGLRAIDQGNYIAVGTTLATLTVTQPITVIFSLPEDDLPTLLSSMKSKTGLSVRAFDRAGQIELATGKLATLDNQVDTTTGTIKLRATFDNKNDTLFPNQFVNVKLLTEVQNDALVAPTASIQKGAAGSFVYLLNDDMTVSVRPIKTGTTDNDKIAVLEGLKEGDKVITDGVDKLRDGAKVIIPENAVTPHADKEIKKKHKEKE